MKERFCYNYDKRADGGMKVGIIGGGSIGLLLAGRLGKKHEVTLFTRTKSQADQINCAGGIEIKGIHPVFTECKADNCNV